MDLKDFIERSLIDICMGIRNAQSMISQETGNYPISPAYIDGKPVYNKNIEKIEFDVCVTVSKTKTSEKDGGVRISVLSASLSSEKNEAVENVSRIKFSVPFHPAALNSSK